MSIASILSISDERFHLPNQVISNWSIGNSKSHRARDNGLIGLILVAGQPTRASILKKDSVQMMSIYFQMGSTSTSKDVLWIALDLQQILT